MAEQVFVSSTDINYLVFLNLFGHALGDKIFLFVFYLLQQIPNKNQETVILGSLLQMPLERLNF